MPAISFIDALFDAVIEQDLDDSLMTLAYVSEAELNKFVAKDGPFKRATILQIAILNRMPELIEALIKKGADIHLTISSKRQTPYTLLKEQKDFIMLALCVKEDDARVLNLFAILNYPEITYTDAIAIINKDKSKLTTSDLGQLLFDVIQHKLIRKNLG